MDWDASLNPPIPPAPQSARLEQQQSRQHQQQQQQQGHQPQRPGGQLQAAAGEAEDAQMEEAGPASQPEQQQQPQQQQLLHDPWMLEQSELMLRIVDELAEEAPNPNMCVLSAPAQMQLRHQYIQAFYTQLQQHQPVDLAAERSWVRLQLGIPALSYSCSDDGEEPPLSPTQEASAGPQADLPGAHHQQQQQQQQQQPHAPRRSGRPNKGTMSATFAATHGPVAGPSQGAPSEPGGRGGRGNRSQRKSQQQLPATPTPPAAPTSRRKGRKGRRTP